MEKRIGIVGMGFIGSHLYRRILEDRTLGLEVAFVWSRSPARRAGVPPALVLEDLGDFAEAEPDLIVEVAHPDITRDHGEQFLHQADYMITSVTALADDALHERLLSAAQNNGRHLFVPHGALVGTNALLEQRDSWTDVTITFRKHPDNIDFADSGIDPASVTGETVLHDGPVREIAARFPRNVNTMVTCALASLGLDRTRAVFVADPTLDKAIAQVEAHGRDGARLMTLKEQPAVGVSGTEMQAAVLRSVAAAARHAPGLVFV